MQHTVYVAYDFELELEEAGTPVTMTKTDLTLFAAAVAAVGVVAAAESVDQTFVELLRVSAA